jgi:hypothetical protein
VAWLLLAVANSGCSLVAATSPPPAPYIPDTAGVVRDREVVGDALRFRLDDGRDFMFPIGGHFIGGSQPAAGDLLLAGNLPTPWVYWASLSPPESGITPEGCFLLSGRATATATHIFKTVSDGSGDLVIVFPKAPGWTDAGFRDSSDMLAGVRTCINEDGQAFHHGF